MFYKIEKIIKSNMYMYQFYLKLKYHKSDALLYKFMEESENLDLIENDDRFEKIVRQIKALPGKYKIPSGYNAESFLYGHLHNLINYSGKTCCTAYHLLRVEHGIDFNEDTELWDFPQNMCPSIFQGSYKKKALLCKHPDIPVFAIGPYIAYAPSFYREKYIQRLKEKMGQTLLVFPVHSHEMLRVDYDRNILIQRLEKYKETYQTILICTYWNDYTNTLTDTLRKRGYKIVSGGFRSDRKFLSRLKTLFLLSDCVTSNGLGSYIGYSLFFYKPFFFITEPEKLSSDHVQPSTYHSNCRTMYQLFGQENQNITIEQMNFCNKFWGFNQVKTPDEIKEILEITEDIYNATSGNINRISHAVKRLCDKYKNSQNSKYNLLKDSILDDE